VEVLRFALLGLGTGAVYALLAQGLVLVYRGSGILNFAQGALAMVGAYTYYYTVVEHGAPKFVGLGIALCVCAALGAAIQVVVLQPMRRASGLARVTATLGVLIILQSSAFLWFGHDPVSVPSLLPTQPVRIGSDQLVVGADRLYILAISAGLTALLWFLYKFSAFGLTNSAIAEDQVVAATLGHSPTAIASMNWAIGSALAGLGGVLIAPIIFLEPTNLVLLVLPAMAIALIGRFTSFPLTFLVALVVGVSGAEIQRFVPQPGWATAVPFLAVACLLTLRGTALPLRSLVLERMPAVGTGQIRWIPVVVGYALTAWWSLGSSPEWAAAAAVTFGIATIALSVVVITGYAGQLSLTQSVLAGVGALVAAKLTSHMSFLPALVLAAAVCAAVGAVVGVPALRTRGITLAIATLGLGGAISAVLLSNVEYTGGVAGIYVPVPSIMGWSIDPFFYADRYAFTCMTIFALLSIGVANLRRGVTGRRLLAVRSNERAAAALGLNNALLKTYAFAVGAGIAGVGGVLTAFQQSSVQVSRTQTFTVVACILLVSVVVAGGVGFVSGALIGASMVSGGLLTLLLHDVPRLNDYLPLCGGLVLVLVLIFEPDGLAGLLARFGSGRHLRRIRHLSWPLSRRSEKAIVPPRASRNTLGEAIRVAPTVLRVSELCVSFGAVTAVSNVDFDVQPGEVHSIIGPNGAGKTTLIDAITGFVPAQHGSILLGDRELTSMSPRKRAAAGISRSFQSLELFEGLTVAENILVASEHAHPVRYVTDFFCPGNRRLERAEEQIMAQFELLPHADSLPEAISFGLRKTVAIARAVAALPPVLLLDEPAAGLDDHEAAELAELIRRVAKEWGMAVVLVEHKLDLVMSLSDRVTVMNHGGVMMTGAPDEVVDNADVMDAYLGTSVPVPVS
jgi:ABC-type branched-subunit amino acid transport system ATPase component/branched-subunit amino acid ABC-type transport system permease component